jgi:hypothetical protein
MKYQAKNMAFTVILGTLTWNNQEGFTGSFKPIIIAISNQQGQAHLPPWVMYRLEQADKAMENVSNTNSILSFIPFSETYTYFNKTPTYHGAVQSDEL